MLRAFQIAMLSNLNRMLVLHLTMEGLGFDEQAVGVGWEREVLFHVHRVKGFCTFVGQVQQIAHSDIFAL